MGQTVQPHASHLYETLDEADGFARLARAHVDDGELAAAARELGLLAGAATAALSRIAVMLEPYPGDQPVDTRQAERLAEAIRQHRSQSKPMAWSGRDRTLYDALGDTAEGPRAATHVLGDRP